ncbi:MAG: phosphopantetheine-binding protein [Sphingobacteriaceae bacterium]|nr:MAG: hypothetical protein E6Q66_08025 [Pedobacter sp.]
MEARNKLLNYFSSKTHYDVSRIEEQNLLENGLLDFLQLIELIVWLETETQKPVELEQLIQEDKITFKAVEAYLVEHSPM